jgi:hypothetical protein
MVPDELVGHPERSPTDRLMGLYRGHTVLSGEEAAARFPEAMVWFDQQCGDLAERGDAILCVSKRNRLSVEFPNRPYGTPRIIWRSETGLWVRYSCHVTPQAQCTRCQTWQNIYNFKDPKQVPYETSLGECAQCRRRMLGTVQLTMLAQGTVHTINIEGTVDLGEGDPMLLNTSADPAVWDV